MSDEYQAALAFLYARLNYERTEMPRIPSELRLGRMRRLLHELDDPQDTLRIIHVAGTKGKGSTSAMIAAALSASGFRTGLFCSPHLHRVEERFRIDGREITSGDLIALIHAVRPAVDRLDAAAARHGSRGLTFFEVTTAIGLLHFARQKTAAVLLEVGLGGRLDSTNAIRPVLSVLTSISHDHTRQLGSTLAAIATEKAGIIKRRGLVVSGVRGDAAREAIACVARQRKARIHRIDDDFQSHYEPPVPPLNRPTPGRVAVRTWRRSWEPVELPLLGEHQAHNAAVALASLDALADSGIEVAPERVRDGFAALEWPARVEVRGRSPWLVIDGAHNVASAEALAQTLRTCFPSGSRTLVFGTSRDKDLSGQLAALLPLFDRIIATRYLDNPRSVAPEEVMAAIPFRQGIEVEIAATPRMALARSREITPETGLICVTGSLFLAAETRSLLI